MPGINTRPNQQPPNWNFALIAGAWTAQFPGNVIVQGTIAPSGGVPNGGITGQVLGKISNANGDVSWQSPAYVPNGGAAGQLLGKLNGTDQALTWITPGFYAPGGGTAGQILVKNTLSNGDFVWTSGLRQNTTVDEAAGVAAANTIGFRGLPFSAKAVGAQIIVDASDAGKCVRNTLGGWSIPAGLPTGTVMHLANDSAAGQTVTFPSGTMRQMGTANVGNRTVAQRGIAIIVVMPSGEVWIDGPLT